MSFSDIVTVIEKVLNLAPAAWRWGKKQVSYCSDLENNVNELKIRRDKLKDVYEGEKDIVELSKQHHSQPRNEASGRWLKKAEARLNEANKLVTKGEQEVGQKCLGTCCPRNCVRRYWIGMKVEKWLTDFDMNSSKTETDFECYCSHLEDDVNMLKTKRDELNFLCNGVKDIAEQPRNEANGWLTSAEALVQKASELVRQGEQEVHKICQRTCCLKDCVSSYRLRKEVKQSLTEINRKSSDKDPGFECYCIHFEDDLNMLKTKRDQLSNLYKYEKEIAQLATEHHLQPENEANDWLRRAEDLVQKADELIGQGEQEVHTKHLRTCSPTNCVSSYKLGKKVKEWLIEFDSSSKKDRGFECYCIHLKDDLNTLNTKRDELNNLCKDTKNRVDLDERQQMQRTNEVDGWLRGVLEELENVAKLIEEGKREIDKKCMRTSCPKNCVSSYKLGKQVKKKLIDFDRRIEERRHFDSIPIAVKPLRPPLEERPMDKDVGIETLFEDVWKSVEDESLRVIGIWGMGGVGKTTLLTKIYNRFSLLEKEHSTREYDHVFFIVVGRECDLGKIQRDIWKKLSVPDVDDEWKKTDPNERATRTLSLLKEKSSLFFLDDIWESIDVHTDIGIPRLEDHKPKSKVIFTTRLEEVCDRMKAHKKKVPILAPNKARQLFEEFVGKETVEAVGNLKEFDEIIEECNGLPLAIKTVGKAMAGKKRPTEWEDAIHDLKNRPWRFPDMEEKVFKPLNFSYNRLKDETHRQCFLSCALYPEDYKIPREELVELWVAQGILDAIFDDDDDNVLHSARIKGDVILGDLVQACMLEVVSDEDDEVKMHDLVRDMALWIVQDRGTNKNKILVQQPLDAKKWKEAEKISIFGGSKLEFTRPIKSFSCPILLTLILRHCGIKNIPDEFFSGMPILEVLDLQGNYFLRKLPDNIGELINLQSLNLAETDMRSLPMTMQKLKKLRYLKLQNVNIPAHCLKELTPNFTNLRQLQRHQPNEEIGVTDEVAIIEALQGLEHLCEIDLTLWNSESVKRLLACPKLLKCARKLTAKESYEFYSFYIGSSLGSSSCSSSSTKSMGYLEYLHLETYKREEEASQLQHQLQFPPCSLNQVRSIDKNACYFPKVKDVTIVGCEALVDLTLLVCNAPRLQRFEVKKCNLLHKVIDGEICKTTPLLPSLESAEISNCGALIDLTLFVCNAPGLKRLEVSGCNSLGKVIDGEICKTTPLLPNLESAEISYCEALVDLTLFVCNAPGLKQLEVRGCNFLDKVIHGEICKTTPLFPSLESAKFSCCEALVDLTLFVCNAPGLKWLEVTRCNSLGKVIDGEICKTTPLFPSLESAQISNCRTLVDLTLFVCNAPRLKRLEVTSCNSLGKVIDGKICKTIPLLSSLESVKISYCGALVDLTLFVCNVPGLKRLEVRGCNSLGKVIDGEICKTTPLLPSLESVKISYCGALVDLTLFVCNAPGLKRLEMTSCNSLGKVIDEEICKTTSVLPRLESVEILYCGALVDLTLLVDNALGLKVPMVKSCNSLQEVIGGEIEEDDASKLFASLTSLSLIDLPCLNSICKRTLLFPLMAEIFVHGCPNLRKLPLSDGVVSTLTKIKGEKEWWDALEWDDPRIKQVLEEKELFVGLEPRR